MSWNHRILAHKVKKDIYFQIHEVYYSSGVPDGYTAKPVTVSGETVKDIKWTLNAMLEACEKPILWAGKKFPSEYKS